MNEKLTALKDEILALFDSFTLDADKRSVKGNAQAGRRSRVTSLEITRKLKEWRALSVEKAEKSEKKAA